MPITALPTPPTRGDPANFAARGDAFMAALPTFRTEANALETNVNEKEASATTSAATATTKANEASVSAGAANTSKTAAETARTGAETARTGAEAALDSFDDRYLGAKAVAPTLDNDGAALLTGALYWDTALPGMRSWNGTAWVTLPAATAAAISNTPAAGVTELEVQGAINGLETRKAAALTATRGAFVKADTQSVAFTKTGAGTVSLKAGTYVDVAGTLITFAAATAVTMPALTAGEDYSIWVTPAGALQAVADPFSAPAAPPAADARKIGGFHYGLTAAGTTVAGGSFATAGNGMIWTQANVDDIAGVNKYSFWDLRFRPRCDPHGMALVSGSFWADIYFCSTNHIANGTSRYNTDVASGTVLPRIPLEFGGNGVNTYANGNWWAFNEVATAHGKRLGFEREFVAAAYGVTENQSLGGAASTIPSTARQAGYTTRYGLEQASGHIWTWGADTGHYGETFSWQDVNGGRGQTYTSTNTKVLLGGARGDAAFSGSRASNWSNYPWVSAWSIGLRAFGDHLRLD